MNTNTTFARDELYYADAERTACQIVANLRDTETVALFSAGGERGDWRFRTLVLTDDQASGAEALAHPGETLVTVF